MKLATPYIIFKMHTRLRTKFIKTIDGMKKKKLICHWADTKIKKK